MLASSSALKTVKSNANLASCLKSISDLYMGSLLRKRCMYEASYIKNQGKSPQNASPISLVD